jgi:hypothetical protein
VSADPSAFESAGPTPIATSSSDAEGFPAVVGTMHVLSITDAKALLGQDRLDGHAVAVKGYWIQMMHPSCPAPRRVYTALERYCETQIFSDTPYDGSMCVHVGEATSCSGNVPPAAAETIEPFALREVNGYEALYTRTGHAAAAVLIMHAGDPRAWQCPADQRETCANEFVVDRVAWANGAEVPWDRPKDTWITAKLRASDVLARFSDDEVIAMYPTTTFELGDVDPRFGIGKPTVTWVVRGVLPGLDTAADGDGTRRVDVHLLDDATGDPIDSRPLSEPDYSPGLFRTQAIEIAKNPNDSNYPVFVVRNGNGTVVVRGLIGAGWSSGSDGVERHLAGPPALLQPGTYTVWGWRQDYTSTNMEPPVEACDTEFTIDGLEELRLEAAFTRIGDCEWREPTFEESLF